VPPVYVLTSEDGHRLGLPSQSLPIVALIWLVTQLATVRHLPASPSSLSRLCSASPCEIRLSYSSRGWNPADEHGQLVAGGRPHCVPGTAASSASRSSRRSDTDLTCRQRAPLTTAYRASNPMRRQEPLSYFIVRPYRSGVPATRMLDCSPRCVIGAGGWVSPATAGRARFTFFEIDPTSSDCRNPRYFTFLQHCRRPLT